MKTRLATLCAAAIVMMALAIEGFAVTSFKQENPPPTGTATTKTKKAGKRKPKGKKMGDMRGGIPTGMENCLNALAKMAAGDPLPAYEGRPEQIINTGLLWNDPKAKCSVGDDQAKRMKLFELATAWRKKDAASVRSILQELGASAGR
jgi:hypothetical protein